MSELVYSTRFVKPKIIGLIEEVTEGINKEYNITIIRSSKNKTKILDTYRAPHKSNEKESIKIIKRYKDFRKYCEKSYKLIDNKLI